MSIEDMHNIAGPFLTAMLEAMEDHEKYGGHSTPDFVENGAMRVVGVARADTLRLTLALQETYGLGLATGWDCPECGKLRDEDGACPDGHEFAPQTPEGGKVATLLSVVELCIGIGVRLERARWQ